MSKKIDDKYITALENFTDALGKIVETLRAQQDTGKADTVNEFLKVPMDNLVTVVADLKKVTEKGFSELKTDNQKILKKIESIKHQKEAGMFDKIEDSKNKNKIVDGIKVVILIAAGVLALGMAFKIIGKIDFASVAALSVAIVAISFAFNKIANIKDLNFRKVLVVSSILPLMAAGLALSGFILRGFPTITLMQGLSMMLIGGALGIATYLLLKSITKISARSLLMVPLLPFILPLIAWGLVKSSEILKRIQTLTLKQLLSIGLVGLALGVAAFGISLALKGLKNVTWKEMLMLPLMIPLIAWGIVKASSIFEKFKPVKQPLQLLIGSAVIGLSMLFFAPAIYILGKLNLGQILKGILLIIPLSWAIVQASEIFQDFSPLRMPLQIIVGSLTMGLAILMFTPVFWIIHKFKLKSTDIIRGSFAILAISSAIVLASAIFQAFTPLRAPLQILVGSLTMGLSILMFAPVFWIINKFKLSKKDIVTGAFTILGLAATVVGVSLIFQLGKFDKYPSLPWTLGSGLSILSYGVIVGGIGALMVLAGGGTIGFPILVAGIAATLLLAGSIVAVSLIFQKGKYDKYPTTEWAKGVGGSILVFSLATVAAVGAGIVGLIGRIFTGGKDPLVRIAQSMVDVAKKLNEVNWSSSNYPKKDYTDGVGGLLLTFAKIFAKISVVEGFNKIMSLFGGGGNKSFTVFIDNATDAIVRSKNKLDKVNWSSSNYPKKDYTEGVGGLLLTFANIFAKISVVEGFNKIMSLFGGGGNKSFTAFIDNATDAIVRSKNSLDRVNWSSSNYPTKEYTEGVGGLLVAFADIFWRISKIEGFNTIINRLFGGKSNNFATFIDNATDSMTRANNKLSGVNWSSNFPTKEYAEGVGGLLVAFADVFWKISKVQGFNLIISKLTRTGESDSFTVFIEKASDAMKIANNKIGKVSWTNNFPKKEFSEGVGGLLVSFADAYSKVTKKRLLGRTETFTEFIDNALDSILKIRKKIGSLEWANVKYPTDEYISSVGSFLNIMAESFSKLSRKAMRNIPELKDFVEVSSTSLVEASNILQGGNFTKSPPKDWATQFGEMLTIYSLMLNNLIYKKRDKNKADDIQNLVKNITDIANILNLVDWPSSKYPSEDWIKNVSNAVIDYTSINLKSTSILKSKFGIKEVIDDILDIANKLNTFDWASSKYPDKDWSKSISNLIYNYANIDLGFLKYTIFKSDNIKFIIKDIIDIANKLNEFNWTNARYPDKNWIKNILNLIYEYSSINLKSFSILKSKLAIKEVINNIIEISNNLNKVDWDSVKYPSKIWMKNISDLIYLYISINELNLKIKSSSINDVIDNIIEIANNLNKVDWQSTKYPSKEWMTNLSDSIKVYDTLTGLEVKPNVIDIIDNIISITKKLSSFDWTTIKSPSKEWMTNIYDILNIYMSISDLEVKESVKDVVKNIIDLANSLNNVDWITIKSPSKEWMTNIYDILNIYMSTSDLQVKKSIKNVVDNIVDVANSLNLVDWNSVKYPSKEYIESFSYLMLESSKLISSISLLPNSDFVDFSKNTAKAISQTSLILGSGKYDNLPNREYMSSFSYFMIAISDLIEKYDFNVGKSNKFLNSSNVLAPAIKNWVETISKLDFNNLPNTISSDNLVYGVDAIGKVVGDWKVSINESKNFEESVKFIISSVKEFLNIPEVSPIFSDSMSRFKVGITEVGEGVYNFKKLKLSLNELEEFSKSTKFIITAIQELVKVPNVNDSLVKNMKIVKDALSELIEGVDSFMYEERSLVGKMVRLGMNNKKKRSMEDFNLFSSGLTSLATSLQILSTLKPIPGGIIPNYSAFLTELSKMPDMPKLDTKIAGINKLATSFLTLANSLSKVNENLEGFTKLSKGLFLISVIDDIKFDSVLKSVEKYKSTLQVINQMPEEQVNLLNVIKGLYETLSASINIPLKESEKKEEPVAVEENKNDQQFYSDISEIKSLLNDIVDHLDKPSASGSFYK